MKVLTMLGMVLLSTSCMLDDGSVSKEKIVVGQPTPLPASGPFTDSLRDLLERGVGREQYKSLAPLSSGGDYDVYEEFIFNHGEHWALLLVGLYDEVQLSDSRTASYGDGSYSDTVTLLNNNNITVTAKDGKLTFNFPDFPEGHPSYDKIEIPYDSDSVSVMIGQDKDGGDKVTITVRHGVGKADVFRTDSSGVIQSHITGENFGGEIIEKQVVLKK